MEDKLIQIIGNGGWMAVGTFLGYLLWELRKRVERLEKRIESMSSEFITKEDHYRDVSGWRGEIQRLEDRIERLIEKVLEAKR